MTWEMNYFSLGIITAEFRFGVRIPRGSETKFGDPHLSNHGLPRSHVQDDIFYTQETSGCMRFSTLFRYRRELQCIVLASPVGKQYRIGHRGGGANRDISNTSRSPSVPHSFLYKLKLFLAIRYSHTNRITRLLHNGPFAVLRKAKQTILFVQLEKTLHK